MAGADAVADKLDQPSSVALEPAATAQDPAEAPTVTPADGKRERKLRFDVGDGAPDDDRQPQQLSKEEAHKQASEQGRGLAERLKNVTIAPGGGEAMRLSEVRGGTGALREGVLTDTSENAGAGCCCLRQPRDGFYVVKGPWMIKFRKDDPDGKMVGVPIPLDGAEVSSVGSNEFEIHNIHVKKDFYGKDELKKVRAFRKKAFNHVVLKKFSVASEHERDEWVRMLQAQVEKLRDTLARKLQKSAAMLGPRSQQDRVSTHDSTDTKGSTAAVSRLAAALFAQWEEDEEQWEMALAEEAMSGRILQ